MTPDIHITILGVKPQPKGRPRFANGRAYTPKATRDYEALLAWHFRMAKQDPLEGPLSVELTFTTKSKADIDNLIKACLDAGNGTLWRDDSQVRSVHGEKVKGDEEKIQVVVTRRGK